MITADIHTHTNYFHGKNTVREMYAKACENNLSYYGFSEHTPLPEGFACLLYREGDMKIAFNNYVNEVLTLKKEVEEYNKSATIKKPQVLLGMELDFTPNNTKFMEDLIASYPFDYVIGTVHFIEEENIGRWKANQVNLEERFTFYERYYDFIAKLAQWGKTDIIAHPDFVKIHSIESFHEWLKQDRAIQCLHNTFKIIKQSNMVLEVSTGGLIKECNEIHPSPKILEIAAQYQVPISFASDTHTIDTVCYAFSDLEKFAKSYGYTKHTIFINRKPIELSF